LPFAALYDAVSRTVLVDRFAIAITPSLAFFRQTSVERAPTPRFEVVAVGSAMGRTSGDRVLPNLPAADREAGAVAEMYEDGHVLRGATATRARFLEVAGLGRILHFAGHALVDARDPNLSRLLVSPTADDAVGAVFATDISRHDLRGVRLVILSACETASGRVTRGEGVIGLARAFLKAGASSVIATLWAVDDQRAFELGTAIHNELKQGRSAADALRTAQLTLRRNGLTDIADWAASVVLGGDVTTTSASNLERSQTP
jgi:CHAT domain-containing protein